MWLLSGFIDSLALIICQLALLIGIVFYISSKLVSWFPIIDRYKLPLEVIGILSASISLFFIGGYKNDQEWQTKFKEMEERAIKAEKDAKDANAQIKTVFVDRIKTVKETQVVVQEKIRDISLQIDEQCKVDQSAIDVINEAALNKINKK